MGEARTRRHVSSNTYYGPIQSDPIRFDPTRSDLALLGSALLCFALLGPARPGLAWSNPFDFSHPSKFDFDLYVYAIIEPIDHFLFLSLFKIELELLINSPTVRPNGYLLYHFLDSI